MAKYHQSIMQFLLNSFFISLFQITKAQKNPHYATLATNVAFLH